MRARGRPTSGTPRRGSAPPPSTRAGRRGREPVRRTRYPVAGRLHMRLAHPHKFPSSCGRRRHRPSARGVVTSTARCCVFEISRSIDVRPVASRQPRQSYRSKGKVSARLIGGARFRSGVRPRGSPASERRGLRQQHLADLDATVAEVDLGFAQSFGSSPKARAVQLFQVMYCIRTGEPAPTPG